MSNEDLAEELTLSVIKKKIEALMAYCKKEVDLRPDRRMSCGDYSEGEYDGIKWAYADIYGELEEILDEL